jgi:hypothetical protein
VDGLVLIHEEGSGSELDHGEGELEGAVPPQPHAASAALLTPAVMHELRTHGLVVLDASALLPPADRLRSGACHVVVQSPLTIVTNASPLSLVPVIIVTNASSHTRIFFGYVTV